MRFKKEISLDSFVEDESRALYRELKVVSREIDKSIESKDWGSSFQLLIDLKDPIDDFFESVVVMSEDKELKENRIELLRRVGSLFLRLADFSKVNNC